MKYTKFGTHNMRNLFGLWGKGIATAALAATLLVSGCGKGAQQTSGTPGNPGNFAQTGTASSAGNEGMADAGMEAVAEELSAAVEDLSIPEESIEEVLPEVYVAPEVKLIMVGDILMHMPVNNSGKQEDGTYNFDHLFTYTKDLIGSADVAIVNQEVILGGAELGPSGYPLFNTYYEVGDALMTAGFNVVLHATNHAMDKGKTGLENCLNFWRDNYPDTAVIGVYDTQEDRDNIYVYEQDGIRIAILNYTYGTNGMPLPSGMPYAVNLMDETLIKNDVDAAKEVADFVVLCPHWGTEYTLKETSAQRTWAKFFMECGVDLVIGTHPHVIEPVEMMTDEDGRQMLVYWSLGNYVNSTASTASHIGWRMLGAMAEVTITRDEDGTVRIAEYGAQPLVTYVSKDKKEIAVYPMEDFTEEMGEISFTRTIDKEFGREMCDEVWQQVMGDLPALWVEE